jgi:hypothetical protein
MRIVAPIRRHLHARITVVARAACHGVFLSASINVLHEQDVERLHPGLAAVF